jgi:DNA-binding NarL/FixJ family response regulator
MPNQIRPKPDGEIRRIFLVDDHPMVRERLAEVIQRESDLTICGESEERFGALELIKSTRPHLAIVDLTLINSSGLELVKDLRQQFPEIAILVVSMHEESVHAERAIRAGAMGYITKQEATRKVMLAIRTVLRGEVYLSRAMTAKVASTVVGGGPHTRPCLPVDRLSDRELFVFERLGYGRSTRQIAEELHLDMRTIETYRARIKEKLNLQDANELLQYAIRWMQSSG